MKMPNFYKQITPRRRKKQSNVVKIMKAIILTIIVVVLVFGAYYWGRVYGKEQGYAEGFNFGYGQGMKYTLENYDSVAQWHYFD